MLLNLSLYLTTLMALQLASPIPVFATKRNSNTTSTIASTGYPPCDALLLSGLGHRLLTPTNPLYEPRIQSYYALNTRHHPYCIIQPHNTHEVSAALTTLLNTNDGAGDWHIALRAGGHNLGDSNNVEQGVTIDLLYLNGTTYNREHGTASLGPGAKWEDVYKDLHKYSVVTPGGRDGDVGVGGFLLGGGSTYYMGRQGFACDSVLNYEVVLVNGSIVNANRHEHADLFKALKGGGSNFGIVTRFDMQAYPERNISRGQRAISANYTARFLDAVSGFTDAQETNKDDALVGIITHTQGQTILSTIEVNIDGDTNSSAFDSLAAIPQLSPFSQKVQPLYEAAFDSHFDGDAWAAQATLTFKNTPRILSRVSSAHTRLAKSLEESIGKDTFLSVIFLQPLPSFFADIAAERGGNMFAHTLEGSNNVLWTAGVEVYSNQSDLAVAEVRLQEMVGELKRFTQEEGSGKDLVYLNYAGFAQDPLGSYGVDSVRFMKDVAREYDPEGMFQRRVPGGFKISRVEG